MIVGLIGVFAIVLSKKEGDESTNEEKSELELEDT